METTASPQNPPKKASHGFKQRLSPGAHHFSDDLTLSESYFETSQNQLVGKMQQPFKGSITSFSHSRRSNLTK
jgi:hypothetical protein